MEAVTTAALPGIKADAMLAADLQEQRGEMLIRLGTGSAELKGEQDRTITRAGQGDHE